MPLGPAPASFSWPASGLLVDGAGEGLGGVVEPLGTTVVDPLGVLDVAAGGPFAGAGCALGFIIQHSITRFRSNSKSEFQVSSV